MPAEVTTDQIWKEIEKHLFAVLGMVTAQGEARTVGVVYVVKDRELYIGTSKRAWKTQYIRQNPHVSITVTLAKRIPFLPFIPIPPATITFRGEATVHAENELGAGILNALYRGMEVGEEFVAESCVIRVKPHGDFITYGVGVSMWTMRNPEKSRGRARVS